MGHVCRAILLMQKSLREVQQVNGHLIPPAFWVKGYVKLTKQCYYYIALKNTREQYV